AGVEAPRMPPVYSLVLALLVGVVAIDLVAMRRMAHQRVGVTGEGWREYARLAPVDVARLNPTQRRLVVLGRQRHQATDADTARRLELAMDQLVREHRRQLT
ncbi:MAG: hypothetical protein JWN67_4374, partial [Actinomycetia bacterium]|nr:hypothetical protein [Actinomycetes bacterium]